MSGVCWDVAEPMLIVIYGRQTSLQHWYSVLCNKFHTHDKVGRVHNDLRFDAYRKFAMFDRRRILCECARSTTIVAKEMSDRKR